MKKIGKITRVAVKRAFKKLREKNNLFCNSLNSEILVTKLYLNHINGNAKKRDLKEVILRLLTVILVEEILEKGVLEENRNDEKYEYFGISYKTDGEIFRMVLSREKGKDEIFLLSTFVQD